MKQESTSIIQLVERKYGLYKCEKTPFVRQMIREFAKYEKKLNRIENYQKMQNDGITLSKEVLALIGKKERFINHIKELQNIANMYIKSSSQYTEVVLETMEERIKAEVEKRVKGELARLSDFLVIAETLNEKDHISPAPLIKLPKKKQEAILGNYTKITKLTHNKCTSIREESRKLQGILSKLTKNEDIKSYVDSIMRDGSVADMKFEISEGPEYEFVMLPPSGSLEMSEQVKLEGTSCFYLNEFFEEIEEALPCQEDVEMPEFEDVKSINLRRTTVEESIAPSNVDASQGSEFEIAMRRSKKREFDSKEEVKDGIQSVEIQEIKETEEFDDKYLNRFGVFANE